MRVGPLYLKIPIKLLSLAACLATLGFLAYGHISDPGPAATRNHRPTRAPSYHSIQGFHYAASREGRPVLQFRSDLFEIHKKKIGKLRFGFLHEVVFSHARIKLFDLENMEATRTRNGEHPLSNQAERKAGAAPAPAPCIFDQALRLELIPSIQNKRVVTAIFEPIQLELFAQDQKQIAITAEKATLNFKTREMAFTGNVQWSASSKSILTDRLIASLSQSQLYCPGQFVFKDRNTTERGQELHADFFLRHAAITERPGRQDLAKMDGDRR